MEDTDITKVVLVSHISPQATVDAVSNFFVFCGPIRTIKLNGDPTVDEYLSAVIEFQKAESAETALLLYVGRTRILPSSIWSLEGSCRNRFQSFPTRWIGIHSSFRGTMACFLMFKEHTRVWYGYRCIIAAIGWVSMAFFIAAIGWVSMAFFIAAIGWVFTRTLCN